MLADFNAANGSDTGAASLVTMNLDGSGKQALFEAVFERVETDAARTIQAFSAQLRQQVDLEALTGELLAVVEQTMQPTRVSLWLRPSPHDSLDTPRSEAPPTTWTY